MLPKLEISEMKESSDSIIHPSCTEFINVPSFPLKAYEIVSDPQYNKIVRWTEEGDAFIIANKNEFSDRVLPKYFKHKNLSTFVRQLNIYGFKKTKYKNEDNCFAHPDFQLSNKRLLLNMKRKATKPKKGENRSTTSETQYITKEEVHSLFESVNLRIDEQNARIEQLTQTNKDFKNSVLCLYNQLEKSRERVLQLEKIVLDHQLKVSNGPPPIMDGKLAEQMKEKPINDKHIMMDNNLYNMFTSFVKCFINNMPAHELNKFMNPNNASNLFITNRNSPNTVSQEILPYNTPDLKGLSNNDVMNQAPMIENGPLSRELSERSVRLGSLAKSPNKREKNSLRSHNRIENDAWEKICELKSISGSQGEEDFIQNLHKSTKAPNPFVYSLDNNSFISEIDHQKEQFGDNMSVGSHKKLNDIASFHNLQNHNFDLMSQPSNKGFSDVKSEQSHGRER